MGETETVAVVFDLIAQVAITLGLHPATKHPGCMVLAVDERWTLAVNGHRENKSHNGVAVPPFRCYAEYNGWPAGMFTPRDGWMAAGAEANESALIAALRKRLREVPA